MEKDRSSASIDVTKCVVDILKRADYKHKTEKEVLDIVEESLYLYTMDKLYEWGISVNGIFFNDLDSSLDVIDKILYNEAVARESYFKQYIHCILYIIGEIRKQDQIELLEIELDDDVVFLEDNHSNIKAIAINENTKDYKIPSAIINAYRSKYIDKEKTLVK